MADARHVRFARELEEQDERVAAVLATLRGLEADTAELRTHAEAAAAFRAAYPGERARLDAAAAAARDELSEREAARAEAEVDVERARRESDRDDARRALARAEDAETAARRKLAHVEEERAALEREAERLDTEQPRLEARARELGGRLASDPRVTRIDVDPAGLDAVLDWASRARAALFVAAGVVESERERIVREANELATAALGDSAAATNVTLVRERIERAAGP